MKKSTKIIFLLAVSLTLLMFGTAQAITTPLQVGPANAQNGFPEIFTDSNVVALELCLDPLFCAFDPPIPGNDFSELVGFGAEAFWWSADAIIADAVTNVDAILVLAVEAAWLNELPAPGEQFPFTRLRIRADVPVIGTYTVTHPYGQEVFEVTAVGPGNEINMSRDIPVIGFGVPHNGAVGPFLTAVAPPPPAGFVGDPGIDQTVTGSPDGNNFFRIVGPGIDVQTDLFAVQGKIFTGVLGTPLSVLRSTYARLADGVHIHVLGTTAPNAAVDVTAGASVQNLIADATGRFFSHIDMPGATVVPASVTVVATAAPNGPTTIISPLVDVVTITQANFNTGTNELTIQAFSSDQVAPLPTLTAVGFGALVAGSLTVVAPIPPSVVTVNSSAGGSDTEPVIMLEEAPGLPPPPPPPGNFSISGRVTSILNTAIGGVTMTLTGDASATTTTNASGTYSFTGLSNGTYTVTPTRLGMAFIPVSRTVIINNANVTGANFTGTRAR